MAKRCSLIAVKVLGDSGQGSTSTVIQGIEWTVKDAQSSGQIQKSVSLSPPLTCEDVRVALTSEERL